MPNFADQLLTQLGGFAGQTAGGLLGIGLGAYNDNRQEIQNRKLMNQQIAGQEQLTNYNFQKQLEMWKATNYSAQMEQLQKAGLNPGLLYGMGGGGGQTTDVKTGSVSGSQAQQNPGEAQAMAGMGIQSMMMQSQIQLNQAQARKLNVEADKTAGVDTTKTQTEIESLKVGMKTQEGIQAMNKAETFIKNLQGQFDANTMQDRINQVNWNSRQALAQLGIAQNEEYMSDETIQAKIKIIEQEAIGSTLRNALTQAQTDATRQGIKVDQAEIKKIEAEIPQIQAQIAQKWVELQQTGTHLTQDQQKIEIQKFTENVKANYPGIGQTLGRLINDGIESIFDTFKGGRPQRVEGVK